MDIQEILRAVNEATGAIREDIDDEDEDGLNLDVQLFTEDDQLKLFIAAENASGATYDIKDADEAGQFFAQYLKDYVL